MQIPNGGYDASWVAPQVSAYAQAAETATRPLTRMLEQVLNARLNEKAQLAQNQFASQQMERELAARSMMQEQSREDQFAHEMLMAEQKRQQEYDAAAAMSAALYGGGGGSPYASMTTPDGKVAPGTGPSLSFEGVMGSSMGGFTPPTPQQTMALGPQGVASVYNNQQQNATNARITAEQARTNREQEQAAAAKAQAMQQAFASTAQAIESAPLTPDMKQALLARAQQDPDGAAGQLADILKPAAPRAKTQAEQDKEMGTFSRNLGGGSIDWPISLSPDSEEYRVAGGAISKMPADGKAAIKLQAKELAMKGLTATSPVMATIFSGSLPMNETNKPLIEAAQKMLADRTDEQFTLLAQALGWKDEAQLNQEWVERGMRDRMEFGLSPEAPAQAAPPQAPARPMSSEDYARKLALEGVRDERELDRLVEEYEASQRRYLDIPAEDSKALLNAVTPRKP